MDSGQLGVVVGNEAVDRSGFRDPLFLLAPARSYSTVSIALLAGHPELYGLPETSLFLRETVGEIMAMPAGQFTEQDGHRHLLMGLERAIAQLHDGSQDNDALERALDWIRQRPEMSTTAVMDYLLRLVCPRIAVEKSPATVESAAALARCMRAYPGARYLHLTRHPVSTQRSMLSLYSQFYFPAGLARAERVRQCLLSWYSRHLRIVRALQVLPPSQWMRVRAEDLIGDPRAWLPRVLDWLDLGYDEAIIDRMLGTQHWEFAAWDGHIGFGGADPKFLAAPGLRPAGPPEQDLTDPGWDISDDLRYKIISLARYLGY
jgi:sulfotransferase family protein